MLRSIGSVTFLALFMVGCGGGDGGSGGGGGGSLNTYSIGGTVTGLTGSGLVLQTNAGDVASVSKAGAFTFPNALGSGAAYTVTVKTQPSTPAQNCVVTNGSGTVGTANITTVAVACSTGTGYTVGGTVSGLVGTGLVLRDNGGDDLAVAANGAIAFPTKIPSGATYSVTVFTQPTSPAQTCVITQGSGTVGTANITTVAVACSTGTGYTIGGTVTGLTGSGLVLQTNAGDVASVSKAGAFTFPNALGSGAAYTVTVKTQPSAPVQICSVTNGSGTIGTANITNVAVACSTGTHYTVRGTVSGLVGSGLTLEICTRIFRLRESCGNPKQIGADGTYTLGTVDLSQQQAYFRVSISQQPSSPPQDCWIGNENIRDLAASGAGFTVACADHYVYSEHAYVTNAADNTLWSYSVDATTGALAVIGAPTATGASPHAIVGFYCCEGVALKVKYVYVANEGSNDVSAFAVDITTGALTAVPGSPFPAGTDPQAMALYGSLLFVANAGSDNVSAYTIDMSTGALTALPGYPVAVGKSPTSIVVDPDNGIVFVANHGGSNDISAFYFYNLIPVPGSPFPAGGNPLSLALTFWQGGMFLYTANPDATNPSMSGFSVDGTTGAFSPLSGSPFPQPVSHYIATMPVGLYIGFGPGGPQIPYLYVTSGASILGYASDIAAGALTALPGFPVSAGANAYSISIDPTNQFLYVANDGAGNISGFRLDASTGALAPMAGSPFPAGNHPQFIATF